MFKKGEKVMCINASNIGNHIEPILGRVYVILNDTASSTFVQVIGVSRLLLARRFIKLTPLLEALS